MALRTFVKISQVNNLSDARYCAGMGVAALGFNLEPGTIHYIDPEKFIELSEWVAGVSFTAEFQEAKPETIMRLLPEYPVDSIQIDKAEDLAALTSLDLPLILRITVDAATSIEKLDALMAEHHNYVQFFLLEASNRAPLTEITLHRLLSLSEKYTIVADLNIKPDRATALLDQYPLKGIALKGGEEIRAGYKDFDELADMLEALEVDEAY